MSTTPTAEALARQTAPLPAAGRPAPSDQMPSDQTPPDRMPSPLAPPATARVIARRHPGRWVAAVVIVVLLVAVIRWAARDDAFRWPDFAHYLFDPQVLRGVGNTLRLSLIVEAIALVLGTGVAIMRLSGSRFISGVAFVYSWLFRGVPVNVILVILLAVASGRFEPTLTLAVPFGGPVLFSFDTANVDLTDASPLPFYLALIGFALSETGYLAELIRAGLISVPPSQVEAAHALGMSPGVALRRIVLPQAIRVIVPTAGNEFINLLRMTSLAVIIGYSELMTTVQRIYEMNFLNIPLLMVASFWYLLMTSVFTVGQQLLARRLGRGFTTA